MKSLFTLSALLCSFLSFGQNFEHFINPNYEYYFEYDDEPGVYHTFSIVDSIEQNDTLLLFPHKVVKAPSGNGSTLISCSECWYEARENLHGEKYAFNNDTWSFKNSEDQDVSLSFDMNIEDSSLILSSLDTNYFFFRSINSEDEIFGQIESVANFFIKAYSNSLLIDVPFDSITFPYSQQYGFYSFFDIYQFPLEYKSFHLIGHNTWEDGVKLKSKRELVNWNVNDIYVLKRVYNDATWYYEHLVDSIYENTEGLILYSSVTKKIQYPFNDPVYEYYIDSTFYSHSDNFLAYPLEYNFNHYSFFLPNPSYSLRIPHFEEGEFNGISRKKYSWLADMPYACPDDTLCFSPNTGESNQSGETWYEDIGLVSSFYFNSDGNPGSDIYQSLELIAYKLGSEIYGDPYQITSLNGLAGSKIQVYPNPTKDQVNFELETDHFEILDLNGKLLISGSGGSASLADLSNGIYILKAFKDGVFYSQKLVKE